MPLQPGSKVRLVTPDNLRLDGAEAVVAEVTAWGAHVRTPAAATGRFRALAAEMCPDGPELLAVTATPEAVETPVDLRYPHRAKELGYSGDACPHCGGFKMRRNGSCLLCDDCGSASGCS